MEGALAEMSAEINEIFSDFEREHGGLLESNDEGSVILERFLFEEYDDLRQSNLPGVMGRYSRRASDESSVD